MTVNEKAVEAVRNELAKELIWIPDNMIVGFLTAALPFLHPDRDSNALLIALQHIISIPENVPGGMSAADALVAITACAKSAIAKTRPAPMPSRDSVIEALREIQDMPATMVNDSESLRHTIKTMQQIARTALVKSVRSLKSTGAPEKGK